MPPSDDAPYVECGGKVAKETTYYDREQVLRQV
jgi:hypothetical protein